MKIKIISYDFNKNIIVNQDNYQDNIKDFISEYFNILKDNWIYINMSNKLEIDNILYLRYDYEIENLKCLQYNKLNENIKLFNSSIIKEILDNMKSLTYNKDIFYSYICGRWYFSIKPEYKKSINKQLKQIFSDYDTYFIRDDIICDFNIDIFEKNIDNIDGLTLLLEQYKDLEQYKYSEQYNINLEQKMKEIYICIKYLCMHKNNKIVQFYNKNNINIKNKIIIDNSIKYFIKLYKENYNIEDIIFLYRNKKLNIKDIIDNLRQLHSQNYIIKDKCIYSNTFDKQYQEEEYFYRLHYENDIDFITFLILNGKLSLNNNMRNLICFDDTNISKFCNEIITHYEKLKQEYDNFKSSLK